MNTADSYPRIADKCSNLAWTGMFACKMEIQPLSKQ